MRIKRLLALGLCAVALVLTCGQHKKEVHAAAQKERSTSAARSSHPRSASTRRRRKARAPLPTVREINAEGLKKILQRNATAPRPLLINFWATWCGPCRDEFPDLIQIDADYKTRNLDFVIVSLDDPADIKTTVPRYLRRMRAQMPAYLLNEEEPNTAIDALDPEWSGGMPATFLLNANGQVVYKHLGPINPAELRAELEKVTEKQ